MCCRCLRNWGSSGKARGEDVPDIIEAWNKLDLLDAESAETCRHVAEREGDIVLVSALTGEGVATLERTISNHMTRGNRVYELHLAQDDGAALAWLHEHGEVIGTDYEGDSVTVSARLSDAAYARFRAR